MLSLPVETIDEIILFCDSLSNVMLRYTSTMLYAKINKQSINICAEAAKIGSLAIMRFGHQLNKLMYPLTVETFGYAAENGNLDVMKWLKENGCPWDENTFKYAVVHGNLENMKWLKENGCPWDEYTFANAIINGNFENIKWLEDNGCPR